MIAAFLHYKQLRRPAEDWVCGQLSQEEEELMSSHPFIRMYMQIVIDAGGRDTFFSGVTTGKVHMFL
jgi:hypothetical protein